MWQGVEQVTVVETAAAMGRGNRACHNLCSQSPSYTPRTRRQDHRHHTNHRMNSNLRVAWARRVGCETAWRCARVVRMCTIKRMKARACLLIGAL